MVDEPHQELLSPQPAKPTNPWNYFVLAAIVTPLAVLMVPSIFTGSIGRGEKRQPVTRAFRVCAAVAAMVGIYSSYKIAGYFVPSLAPSITCSDKAVTKLAGEIVRDRLLKNPNAAVSISAVRTRGSKDAVLQCFATATISGASWRDGEHFITFSAEQTDDGQNIYVAARFAD